MPVERIDKEKVLIIKDVGSLIITIRNQKVIIDRDLAEIYGVETRRLNEQVKRNPDRFPEDFMFQLTKEEADVWVRSRSQFAILKRGKTIKYLPYAFMLNGTQEESEGEGEAETNLKPIQEYPANFQLGNGMLPNCERTGSAIKKVLGGGGNKKGPFGPRWLRHPPPNDRIDCINGKNLSNVKHFLPGGEGTIFAKGRCKIGITFKKGGARCPDDRGGKSATACGKNRLPGNCATACCPNSLGTFSPPSGQQAGWHIRLCHQVDRIPSACAARRQVRKSSKDYYPAQKRSKLN